MLVQKGNCNGGKAEHGLKRSVNLICMPPIVVCKFEGV